METVSLFNNGTSLRFSHPLFKETHAKIATQLLERLSHVQRVISTPRHIDITFVDTKRAVDNIVSASAVISEVLDLPVRSTWSLVMDTETLAALMPYADFIGSDWFVPLDVLDKVVCSQDSCEHVSP